MCSLPTLLLANLSVLLKSSTKNFLVTCRFGIMFSRLSLTIGLSRKSTVFNLVQNVPDSRHLISQFVSLFSSQLNTSSVYLRVAWEKEGAWYQFIFQPLVQNLEENTINVPWIARLQLFLFKIVHRVHYSKSKLSPISDHCQGAEGTLSHSFWFCLKLQSYWQELAIFGYSETVSSLRYFLHLALMLSMVVAKWD